jgi:Xaa-Pro aminopeptidase
MLYSRAFLSWDPPLAPRRLFIDGDRVDAPGVKQHLLLDLGLEAEYRIQVLPYKSILSELKALCADLSPREKVWVSDKASYAVSEAIPKVSGPQSAPSERR